MLGDVSPRGGREYGIGAFEESADVLLEELIKNDQKSLGEDLHKRAARIDRDKRRDAELAKERDKALNVLRGMHGVDLH
jgi:hypothetical protein